MKILNTIQLCRCVQLTTCVQATKPLPKPMRLMAPYGAPKKQWKWTVNIWVRSRNCGCLVTWFCYQLIAKPGNKTATVLWPDPYKIHGAFWNNVHCISINSVPIVTVPWCSIDKSHTDFSSKSRSNSSPLGQNGRPVFQTMFSDAFSWMKSFVFWLKFK